MKTKIKELKQLLKKYKIDISKMDNDHCYLIEVDFRESVRKSIARGVKPTAEEINMFMCSLKTKLKECGVDNTVLIPISDITPKIEIFEINTKK